MCLIIQSASCMKKEQLAFNFFKLHLIIRCTLMSEKYGMFVFCMYFPISFYQDILYSTRLWNPAHNNLLQRKNAWFLSL